MVILQLEEQPPIIQAIFAGAVDEVQELITFKQDVNCIDCEKRTPLHAAAFKGDAVIMDILLKNGARVNAKDSKWVTPLHRACAAEADQVVALLLRSRADVCARDRLWQTPLHVAAANDAYNCIQQLLSFVPNPNVTDRSGRTALHHAAYNGHHYVAELLISKGCIVNACDKKDCRPLHLAVQMGHVPVVELLIKNNADINAKDRNQYTPLHVCAATGIDTVCKILLGAGADINAQNSYGNTPLHIACLNGHLNVCQELVRNGANLECSNFRGQTPLHIAAASTHGVECLMFLLRQKVDLNRQSLDGRTPLHMTAIHGRFTRSKTLIDNGALIDCMDKNGCTPLHIAAQYGHDLLANTLLSYGASPSKKGYEGRTPLHMCCLSGYVECCRKFVQAGVDLNERDDRGKTPLHCAAYKGSYECLDLLVSNRADFKLADSLQRLPLHYATSQGHYQCVLTLVGIGSPVNVQDVEGCTPLHLAAAYDHEGKCIEYLLDHKADRTVKDNRGFTPLHYAIAGAQANGTVSVGLIRLSKGVKETEGKEETRHTLDVSAVDITPLHLAAKLGNIDILRLVLPLCDDVNVRTNQGLTALMLAAREGRISCVHVLLRFGAKVALADYVNNMTPVHYSAKNGHSQCLTLLLHNTEDRDVIDMLDSQNRTALMLAVSGNHVECVQALLKCGADPNVVDTDNHSCLFRAVVNGQNGIVQLLLSNNAQVNIKDVNGKTVLHLAAACGHLVCMQMIVAYMTEDDVKVKDNHQFTALHWACYNGHATCVQYLVEKNIFKDMDGSPFTPVHCAMCTGSHRCLEFLIDHFGPDIVHLRDSRKRTPMHVAAIHGSVACCKYLIDFGGKTQVYDEDKRTPLILASLYGQTHVITLLLMFTKNPNSCDNLGNTALHWACLKKYTQTALSLLDEEIREDLDVNIANNDKKTPLHIAAKNGMVEVTRELLRKGASVLAVDNEGLTPALCCTPNSNVAQCLALILQTLPQFSQQNATQDVLNLSPFYKNILVPTPFDKRKDECLQTDISLLSTPKELDARPKLSSEKLSRKSSTTVTFKRNLTMNNDDCFIIESKDFHESVPKQAPRPEKTGLTLHKSFSDMSIASRKETKKAIPVPKLKQCRECFRLQHRCSECNMRVLLKKHLTGRTNQKEFNEFLVKCFSETSTDYRRLFNNALEQVGKELNLSDNLKSSNVKSSTSITEQLALLNKNRTLIGGMRRQQAGIANRARVVRKKLSSENLKTSDRVEVKEKKIFVINKDDPVLKELEDSPSLENCSVDVKKPVKTLSQFHLGTACFGDVEDAPERDCTVQNFIIDSKSDTEQNDSIEEVGGGGEALKDVPKKEQEDDEGTSIAVEEAFSDLDTMLEEIEMEFEATDAAAMKKKKSKTDNQGLHNLQ